MRARVKDPLPRFGGRGLPGMLLIVIIPLLLLGSGAAWYWSSDEGGFNEVRKLASVKCLGCLGLDPVVPGFSEFWTVYPDDHREKAGQEVPHPQLVEDILDDDGTEVMILFYWTQGCVPCAEQWDEMVHERIASGQEAGGREGDKYEGLRIISVDAAEDTDLYHTYTPTGTETGVPMTTFLFKDMKGSILWWSHYGKMEVTDLEDLLEDIELFKENEKLKHDYDHISSVDDEK